MLEGLLVAVGGLLGWLSNLWFERRALRTSERENQQLRQELERLQSDLTRMRTTLLSLGANEASERSSPGPDGQLLEQVTERARRTQDAEGRVDVQQLAAHFVSEGVCKPDLDACLQRLVADGRAERSGHWLRIR